MKGVKDWVRMQRYKTPGMDERTYDYQLKMQEKKDIQNKWVYFIIVQYTYIKLI